jgi:hypothetical protein
MTKYIVQSILFDKSKTSLDDAIRYMINNKYMIKKIDITKSLYRFRQLDPKPYEEKGYKFRIKKLNDIISLVLIVIPNI